MDKRFMAPIPGQSLTREKGNAPWEQPPMYSRPEEALAFYMEKLTNEEALDDSLFLLEQGFPLENLVDSMTSYGVMEGYHSYDVKMLISPVLHEHIKALCEGADISIVEFNGPSDNEKRSAKEKQRLMAMLAAEFDKPIAPEDLDTDEAEEALDSEGGDLEEDDLDLDEGPVPPAPEGAGLIKRRN